MQLEDIDKGMDAIAYIMIAAMIIMIAFVCCFFFCNDKRKKLGKSMRIITAVKIFVILVLYIACLGICAAVFALVKSVDAE